MKKPEDFEEMLNTTNLNYNRLVCIDIIPAGDEILEFACCVMNNRFELAKSVIPYYCLIKPATSPFYITNKSEYSKLKVNEHYYTRAYTKGLPKTKAFEVFESWFEKKIKILPGRKLMVLCHDWATKKQLLINWMGEKNLEYYFHFQYRDIMSMALFANDYANTNFSRIPYPKLDFAYICSENKVKTAKYDTFVNCRALVAIYQKMLFSWYSGHVKVW